MNEEKIIYKVAVFRADFNHLVALETKNFDEAKTRWKELTNDWKKALEDKVPLEIEDPEVTSFDPGLVREIKIVPVPEGIEKQVGSNNPYVKQMKQDGLGGTMKFAGELQDGGYK